jgi:ankyrin repeat protein
MNATSRLRSINAWGLLGILFGALGSMSGAPLHEAIMKKEMQLVENQINAGVDINIRDSTWPFTPLTLAVRCGDYKIVQRLLAAGADPNLKPYGGRYGRRLCCLTNTSWKVASFCGSVGVAVANDEPEMFELLVAAKAGLDTCDPYSRHDLLMLASANSYSILQKLLTNPAFSGKLENRCEAGDTPLMHAVAGGVEANVRLLLNVGANPNAQNYSGLTPLHFAVDDGARQIVHALLDARADPNLQSDEGVTPLMLAAIAGDTPVIDLLLKFHAKVDLKAERRWPNILAPGLGNFCSLTSNSDTVVREDGRAIGGFTALGLAAGLGNVQSVEALLKAGANPSESATDGWLPLHWAAGRLVMHHYDRSASDANYVECIRLLLDHGADPNARARYGITPLGLASHFGYVKSMKALLSCARTAVNLSDQFGDTPLDYAAGSENFEAAKLLLEYSANATPGSGDSALIRACQGKGHGRLVRMLLENGANADFRYRKLPNYAQYSLTPSFTNGYEEGYNLPVVGQLEFPQNDAFPLLAAAQAGDPEIVALLLNAVKYTLNGRDADGNNPLLIAIGTCDVATVKAFVDAGAETSPNNKGWSPLHIAAARHSPELIRLFLNSNTVNLCTKRGETPLMLLLDDFPRRQQDSAETNIDDSAETSIDLVLAGGADSTLKDSSGESPVILAAKNPSVPLHTFETLLRSVRNTADLNSALLAAAGSLPSPNDQTSLASTYSNWAKFSLLLEKGANPNTADTEGTPVIVKAVRRGRGDIVANLLNHGAKLDIGDAKIADLWVNELAVDRESASNLLESLNSHGLAPGWIAVRSAANRQFVDALDAFPYGSARVLLAESFLSLGADANVIGKNEKTPLQEADFDESLIGLLLDKGADPNLAPANGPTPLMLNLRALPQLADLVEPTVPERLLAAGAKVELGFANDVSPLAVAAALGDANVVDLLLEWGANPNRKDRNLGRTALMYAAGAELDKQTMTALNSAWAHPPKDRFTKLFFLLQHGARINERDNNGWTSLMYATAIGDAASVQTLLEAGADYSLTANDGTTIEQIIGQSADRTVKRVLREFKMHASAHAKQGGFE